MTIKELQARSHATAMAHGFRADGRERFCEKMLLVMSEISEALEEFRNSRRLNEVYESAGGKPEGIPIELADAVIRIADFCESNQIDLTAALELKMAFNESRPYMHGKQI